MNTHQLASYQRSSLQSGQLASGDSAAQELLFRSCQPALWADEFWTPDGFGLPSTIAENIATSLAFPVLVAWTGLDEKTAAGWRLSVLGVGHWTLRFMVPRAIPSSGFCCGALADAYATVRLDDCIRETSPSEFLIGMLFGKIALPTWKRCLDLALDAELARSQSVASMAESTTERGIWSTDSGSQLCAQLSARMSEQEIRVRVVRELVGDAGLADLLWMIKAEVAEDNAIKIVRRCITHPDWSSATWRMGHDSCPRLVPMVIALGQHASLCPGTARQLAGLGIGRGLASRLRSLPPPQLRHLYERVSGVRGRHVAPFFKRLAHSLPRLTEWCSQPGGEHYRFERITRTLHYLVLLEDLDDSDHLPAAEAIKLLADEDFSRSLRLVACQVAAPGDVGVRLLKLVLRALLRAMEGAGSGYWLSDVWTDLSSVRDWVVTEAGRIDSKCLRRTSLKGLCARAQQWHLQQELDRLPILSWPCPTRQSNWADFCKQHIGELPMRIITLDSTALLSEESLRMRNCVATAYWKRAAGGGRRLFSIEINGERFATMELAHISGTWTVVQCRGRANTPDYLEEHERDSPIGLAMRTIEAYFSEKQGKNRLAPLAVPWKCRACGSDFSSRVDVNNEVRTCPRCAVAGRHFMAVPLLGAQTSAAIASGAERPDR